MLSSLLLLTLCSSTLVAAASHVAPRAPTHAGAFAAAAVQDEVRSRDEVGGHDEVVPDEAVARVNGELIPRDDYYGWLVRAQAEAMFDVYLAHVVVEQEARRLGIGLEEGELEAALERRWRQFVLSTYGGDEGRALEGLAEVGLDKGQRLAVETPKVLREVLAAKVVQARRDPGEDELRRLHAKLFGEDAERVELRLAFFRRYPRLRPGAELDKEEAAEMSAASLRRAQAFVDTMSELPDDRIAPILREQSDPLSLQFHKAVFTDLRDEGGMLRYYRHDLFLGQLQEALESAEVGTVLGPVETPDGFYVARVLRREPAPFAEVRDEVRQMFLDGPATPKELYLLQQELMEQAEVQRGRLVPKGR